MIATSRARVARCEAGLSATAKSRKPAASQLDAVGRRRARRPRSVAVLQSVVRLASRPAPSRAGKLEAARSTVRRPAAAPPVPGRRRAVSATPCRVLAACASEATAASSERFADDAVRAHLPLVRQVVQRMLPRKPPEISTEDLISWGTIGLLDAMRKYDGAREASFSTYAQYRIRGSVLDFLRRCDWLPRSVRQRSHDVEVATVGLERRLGRAPVGEEIAAELGLSLEDYAHTLSACGATSLVPAADLGFGRGEESLSAEDMAPSDGESAPIAKLLRKERVEILAGAIERLPDKERAVVSFYYFEGLTMREMALAMGLTEGRISQLHSQAMIRLRGSLQAQREAGVLG